MENYFDANISTSVDANRDFSLPQFAENRVHALKALVELVLHELESLQKMAIQNTPRNGEDSVSLPDEIVEFESRLIRNALIQTHGNQRSAAHLLGIKHTTLHAKLRRYNIDSRAFVTATGRAVPGAASR
jgi:DNA-binding NtrC family response regulator